MQKPKESEVLAVYRPPLMEQLYALVWFLPGAIIILGLLVSGIKSESVSVSSFLFRGIFLIIFFGIPAWHSFWILTRNKLVIRTDGLEWWYDTEHNFVTWQAIGEWSRRSYIWAGASQYGIYAKDDKFIPIDHFIKLPTSVFLVSDDLWKFRRFRDTSAGELFFRYAPHLFKDLEKQKHS